MGPRAPAVSTFWLSATGQPLLMVSFGLISISLSCEFIGSASAMPFADDYENSRILIICIIDYINHIDRIYEYDAMEQTANRPQLAASLKLSLIK